VFAAHAADRSMVVKAIKDVDPKRRCFRLIGGVLVERTVGEVLPMVEKNLEQVIWSPLPLCTPSRQCSPPAVARPDLDVPCAKTSDGARATMCCVCVRRSTRCWTS
jgi:hypothetical protein